MSLADNVHRLTSEHLTMGPKGPISVPALLDQLDEAITANERAGGSSSGGASLPFGEGAMALLEDIDKSARQFHYDRTYEWYEVPRRLPLLKMIISCWPELDDSDQFLEHATLDWIDQIGAIIAPTKPPRKLTVPCPACSVLYHDGKPALRVHCWDEEGEMLKIWQWTAECACCGAGWMPDQMAWLVKAVYAD